MVLDYVVSHIYDAIVIWVKCIEFQYSGIFDMFITKAKLICTRHIHPQKNRIHCQCSSFLWLNIYLHLFEPK